MRGFLLSSDEMCELVDVPHDRTDTVIGHDPGHEDVAHHRAASSSATGTAHSRHIHPTPLILTVVSVETWQNTHVVISSHLPSTSPLSDGPQ